MKIITNRPYMHFKGKLYYVHSINVDSETGKKIVSYQGLYYPYEYYTRSLEDFTKEVDINREDNITHQRYRFQAVDTYEKEDIFYKIADAVITKLKKDNDIIYNNKYTNNGTMNRESFDYYDNKLSKIYNFILRDDVIISNIDTEILEGQTIYDRPKYIKSIDYFYKKDFKLKEELKGCHSILFELDDKEGINIIKNASNVTIKSIDKTYDHVTSCEKIRVIYYKGE